jgi:hypothetical protein
MDGRECVYSFHDPTSVVKITETCSPVSDKKHIKWAGRWKDFPIIHSVYVGLLHAMNIMNECIRGRPKPALASRPSMTYCASSSISTFQQSYSQNEMQYLTYRDVLVVT